MRRSTVLSDSKFSSHPTQVHSFRIGELSSTSKLLMVGKLQVTKYNGRNQQYQECRGSGQRNGTNKCGNFAFFAGISSVFLPRKIAREWLVGELVFLLIDVFFIVYTIFSLKDTLPLTINIFYHYAGRGRMGICVTYLTSPSGYN